MPFAEAPGSKLHYETTGVGTPIVFVHETAADSRTWEAQIRWFSRFYQCITFNARGFAPSDRPLPTSNYQRYYEDIGCVMDAVGVSKAFLVGHSMGAYSAVHFALNHPERALGIVLAGIGSGSSNVEEYRAEIRSLSDKLREDGMEAMSKPLAFAPSRIQLHNKDFRGWSEFHRHLNEHDAEGTADALKYFHSSRPVLYEFEADLRLMQVPTLIAVGDEDTQCIDPSIFLKRTIPASGLWMCPRTGHPIHLEEPSQFNEAVQSFLHAVQQNAWGARDPRSIGTNLFVHETAPARG